MIALVCVALSAIGFYLSFSVEPFWALAWLAPAPILWLALTRPKPALTFLCAVSAYTLGGLYLAEAYASLFPPAVMALALVAPALCFGFAVLGAGFAARRLGNWAGVFAFASLWTALDYGLSLGPDGAAISPAYTQVAAPLLVQASALFGLWSITFLLGFVSAATAVAVSNKRASLLAAAATVFLVNAGYGAWRMSAPAQGAAVQIGLLADDRTVDAAFKDDPAVAEGTLRSYADATRDLSHRGARIVVWPEKVAVLSPGWRDHALEQLRSLTNEAGLAVIAGVEERGDRRRNRAYVVSPHNAPWRYDKRHLVQGLESKFTVGEAAGAFGQGQGVAICKDMDFPQTLRADARSGHLTMVFVPAWDFNRDGWWHARIAMLRGVENGFAVARAAKEGLLTLSDAYGRQIARAPSSRERMVAVTGTLRAGPGPTLYTRIGDVFAWACVGIGALLVAAAGLARRPRCLAPDVVESA